MMDSKCFLEHSFLESDTASCSVAISLSTLGWEPWQYNKPLNNEMDEFLQGDQDLIAVNREERVDQTADVKLIVSSYEFAMRGGGTRKKHLTCVALRASRLSEFQSRVF